MQIKNLNKYFDHTLLKVTSTKKDYITLCKEALEHSFYSVCVPPIFVPFAKNQLQGSNVKICSVVGFPSGLNNTETKINETKVLLKQGADEIDMVANLSFIKSKSWGKLYSEISFIRNKCSKKVLKVIVESSLLTKDEILNCCLVIKNAKADFIKTSTGFNGPGAKLQDVQFMQQVLYGSDVKIKASGGIRSLASATQFINLGAQRIGSSSGVQIINQLKTGITNETSSRSNY